MQRVELHQLGQQVEGEGVGLRREEAPGGRAEGRRGGRRGQSGVWLATAEVGWLVAAGGAAGHGSGAWALGEPHLSGGAAMVVHCMKCVDISGQVSAVGDPRAWKIFSSWFMSLYPRNHTWRERRGGAGEEVNLSRAA